VNAVLGLLATLFLFAVAAAVGPLRSSGTATLRALLDRAARSDFATFVELVGRDERTGQPIKLNPHQRRMIAHWENQPRSVTLAHPEFGKTSLLVLYVLWTLGRDPSTRVVVASGTAGQAEKILRTVASYIETSAGLARIFPALKPGAVWRNDGLSVAGAPATMKDPNVSTAAPGSGSVLGLRCDLSILDDVLTRDNTRTKDRREELLRWYVSTLASRLAPNAKIIACGTVWHRSDLLHELAKSARFVVERFPVHDGSGASTWPERWPTTRIAERHAELGSREFARAFMCEPIDESSAVIRFEDVEAALHRGVDLPAYFYSSPAETGRCFVGVDPAFTTGENADLSAIAVVCVRPDGTRELLDVQAGRWGFDGITARVAEAAGRYRATIAIETNGGGQFILEDVRKVARGRVHGLHTSATTKAARIERFAAELEARRWIMPARAGMASAQVRALCQEILAFTPEDHLGDRFSALLLALDVIRGEENRPRAAWLRVFPPGSVLRRGI
jgi:predicted phage terminase large subunit-like protein